MLFSTGSPVHCSRKKYGDSEKTPENVSKHQVISAWNTWHGKAAEFLWRIFSIKLFFFPSAIARRITQYSVVHPAYGKG